MDWKKLASDAQVWGNKAKVTAEEAMKLTKEYTERAKVQSYDALVHGTMTGLKDITTFEQIRDQKRLAIFCIAKDQPITARMLLLFPIVFTKAWIESGTVKVMEYADTGELRNTIDITEAPTVLIYCKGECAKRIEDHEEILSFMKDFTFYVQSYPDGLSDLIDESAEKTEN